MSPVPPVTLPPLRSHDDVAQAISAGSYDALLVVGPAPLSRHVAAGPLTEALGRLERVDATLTTERPTVVCAAVAGVPGERLVAATVGDWSTWEQDVRLYALAAQAAAVRAFQAGARQPLLVVAAPADERFRRAVEVAVLGLLAAQWEPFELRAGGERPPRATAVGVVAPGVDLGRLQALGLAASWRATSPGPSPS
ncbi:MAG: hypothetical protein EOO75_17040 [Myxococcales bacterium]|nr:MAG: hypothetical protein EOO75_17040 [Myxococcales bacterium]